MKILNCLAIASMALVCSCSKGVLQEPVAHILIEVNNKTTAMMDLSTDGDPAVGLLTTDPRIFEIPAGKHRFTFSQGGQVLLDTTVVLRPSALMPATRVAVFRSTPSDKLRLVSDDAVGMDTVAAPPFGFATINVLNAAPQLPDVVDVYFYATIRNGLTGEPNQVEAGVIKGVGRNSFSPFTEIYMSRLILDKPLLAGAMTAVVKEPATGTVLLTKDILLQVETGSQVARYVYSACLTGSGFTLLLGK